jgi:hypothetical protein
VPAPPFTQLSALLTLPHALVRTAAGGAGAGMDHGSAHKRPNGEVAKKMNEYKDNQTAWRGAAFVRQQQCRHARCHGGWATLCGRLVVVCHGWVLEIAVVAFGQLVSGSAGISMWQQAGEQHGRCSKRWQSSMGQDPRAAGRGSRPGAAGQGRAGTE